MELRPEDFPPERIRNFSIIAHIDHGKSTLADRLLELTGTISSTMKNKQVLDKLKVERERGITVKAQTATMIQEYNGNKYLLNLVDTPGHVDFSYEVSRSLAACQGCLLLVDACRGVQAQTLANFHLAFAQDLEIIPVINKIDLPTAEPERVASQIEGLLEMESSSILQISAKSGMNCEGIIPSIIERIPCPTGDSKKPLRALVVDSWFDTYVGVISLMSIVDGSVRKGSIIMSANTGKRYEITEVGLMRPHAIPTTALYAGQVGYIVCNMKDAHELLSGDTFFNPKAPVEALPGFQVPKPMVFAGLFPMDTDDFTRLQEAITKLTLNDSSVQVQKETSTALGQGWRIGFLGTLHMDVFRQRLEQEYDAEVIITQPNVLYKFIDKEGSHFVRNPSDFPSFETLSMKRTELLEPMVLATIVAPNDCLGQLLELCNTRRGEQQDLSYIDDTRVLLRFRMPMAEVVTDFYDELKSRSAGYASFDYEEIGYEHSDLVKMDVLLNSKPVDALAVIMHRSKIHYAGRKLAEKMKKVIQRQLFEVAIQVSVNNKVIARETVSALRKNVTAKCYGGDVTRKMKLLNKQKEGKKRMKSVGSVQLSQDAFYTLMSKDK
ncbi:MAG: P-loop containing nucleoside triphosphate hydrolase protein [Piptocephalis tieghemiana]|nr:MAG: P-loop containing nucleoside triphosphate hydrolase protein [Piptocephalis tieghemiana]